MYIFGGNDIRMGTMNNLWMLDLAQVGNLRENVNDSNAPRIEWRPVKTHGSIPGKLQKL